MLHGEGFDPDEGAFWVQYFLEPFPRGINEDQVELYMLELELTGEDEADDWRRGLGWEDDMVTNE